MHPRRGYTLIELLIVMAIIALLTALVLAALFQTLGPPSKKLEAIKEIAGIHQALAVFKADTGVLPPSRLNLTRFAQESDEQTHKTIKAMFGDDFVRNWGKVGVSWQPDGQPVVLEGDQALVFCLGGGPDPSGLSRTRYYEFNRARLLPRPGQTYPSCYDPWNKQPYAYFASEAGPDDCETLGVQPYRDMAGHYQIISAGKDGLFGRQGDAWTPDRAGQVYPAGSAGRDDLANFHGHRLLGN